MNTNNFILLLITVIQLSFTRGRNANHHSSSIDEEFSDIIRNSITLSRKLRVLDPRDVLHQDIDSLIKHIIELTEKIKNNPKLIISNPEAKSRPTRSDPPSGFNALISEDSRLEDIESELTTLKETIEEMKNKSHNSDTSERLGRLETAVESLKRLIDNSNRKKLEEIKNLHNYINNVKEDLDRVKQDFNNIQQRENSLRSEIINDIKGRDFDNASKKLQNLDGGLERNINLIVHEVYNNQAGNFNTVLFFGNSEYLNITTRWIVYQALNFEMESNSHKDYQQVLKLIGGLNMILLDGRLTSAMTYDVVSLKQILRNIVIDTIMVEFINAKTNNYRTVSEIFERIQTHDPKFFVVAIKHVVSHMDQIDIAKLDNVVEENTNLTQRISSYMAVLNELKNKDRLDQPAVVTLALRLRKAAEGCYSLVSDCLKFHSAITNEALILLGTLSTSVNNIISELAICIKNVKYNEYMYAATDGFKHGNDRRIFTWVPKEEITQGYWHIQKKKGENKFFIKNTEHRNEFLYVTGDYDNGSFRRIATRHLNNNSLEQFLWTFVPDGDNVYIKNSLYNEYLFASDHKFDDNGDRRSIYTAQHNTEATLWYVEDCEQLYRKHLSNN